MTKESEARSVAAKTKAEATFKKEERAAEGAKAMLEYQANGREIREQMAKLRALRLAKEAEDKIKSVAEQRAGNSFPTPKAKSTKSAAKPTKAKKTTSKAAPKAAAAVEKIALKRTHQTRIET